MIKQKIFIINFNFLYEILDEVKENLFFDVIKIEDEESLIKDKRFDKKNSLVIVKFNHKFNLKKKFDQKNILNYKDYPLLLLKLIELINIQLLKIRFNYQSKVNIKEYELNLNSKILSKGDLFLKLTEKEIEIILYLSKDNKKHKVLDLQKNIWGYSADMETHTVETHIYRLRKKLYNEFKEEGFILSHPEGYFFK